jgi:hypothetical protein
MHCGNVRWGEQQEDRGAANGIGHLGDIYAGADGGLTANSNG